MSDDDSQLTDEDRAFVEQRRKLAEFDFRELNEWARRVGLASRKRRKLLASVAGKNEISLETLDALHEADWALVQREAAKRRTAATALLKRHHSRQRAALKTVSQHRKRFEYQGGNPVFQTCMWRATGPVNLQLLPFTFNQGTADFIPPAPEFPPPTVGNSLVRFSIAAQANAAGSLDRGFTAVAGFELLTSHVFETTAQSRGILSVTAQFAPLGEILIGAPGDCLGSAGSAGCTLTVLMDVRITPEGEFGFNVPRGDVREIISARVRADCDAETRLVLVGPTGGETYGLTNADLVTVAEGDTIRVTARYVLRLSAALRGLATADFSDAPSGLNVPVVVAKIVT